MNKQIFALAVGALLLLALSPPASAHEPYSNWMKPDGDGSCCNNQDCAISRAFWSPELERWVALGPTGQWVIVPPEAELDPQRVANPDGNAHLCARVYEGTVRVLCFRRPEARM